MAVDFAIKILSQGWLHDCPPVDLCSHGRVALDIGGTQVENGDEEYGISESALAMLRTIQEDHSSQQPTAERMIFHGCGCLLMSGCPIGIDWAVQHDKNYVRILDVVKYPTTNEAEAIRYPEVDIRISLADYATPIIRFAQEAKTIFGEKDIEDDYDRSMYAKFWEEYDERCDSGLQLLA